MMGAAILIGGYAVGLLFAVAIAELLIDLIGAAIRREYGE